ncbi:MAG: hypothetical protein ACOCWJ_02370 [Verrucomicrobiota bacterium]
MRHWRPKNRTFHIPENRRQRLLDSAKSKRKPFSRVRLTIWLVEFVALLGAIELFLLPSCQSPDASAPSLRPPRPAPPPKAAPDFELKVSLPNSLRPARKPLLPSTKLLAPGSRTAQEKQVRHARSNGLPLEIVNASSGCRRLLAGLGLNKLFIFATTPTESRDWQSLCQAQRDDPKAARRQERTVLEAHETLMEVDPENVPKFKDVVDYLRSGLEERP